MHQRRPNSSIIVATKSLAADGRRAEGRISKQQRHDDDDDGGGYNKKKLKIRVKRRQQAIEGNHHLLCNLALFSFALFSLFGLIAEVTVFRSLDGGGERGGGSSSRVVQLLRGRDVFRVKKDNAAATSKTHDSPAAPFSFSACLIIKDDNIILPEWLAYHYTVLPLHRLIVGVDPQSQTDPTPILDAFEENTQMNITIWRNDSFWKEDGDYIFLKKGFVVPDNMANETLKHELLRNRYLHRQKVFYEACLSQLREENRTWTVLIDADEYLTLNYYDEVEKKSPEYNVSSTRGQLLSSLDQEQSSSSLAEVLSHWEGIPKGKESACVTFGRYLFVSKEEDNVGDSKELPMSTDHDDDFNTTLFHTLRYHQRVSLTSSQLGKSIVDASRYDDSPIDNPHRPKELCTGEKFVPNLSETDILKTVTGIIPDSREDTPFRVHHYVGSWEAFRKPGLDIRGRGTFDKRNNVKELVEDSTIMSSSWLDKFTRLVGGKEKALELTQTIRLREEKEMARRIMEQEGQQQQQQQQLD